MCGAVGCCSLTHESRSPNLILRRQQSARTCVRIHFGSRMRILQLQWQHPPCSKAAAVAAVEPKPPPNEGLAAPAPILVAPAAADDAPKPNAGLDAAAAPFAAVLEAL